MRSRQPLIPFASMTMPAAFEDAGARDDVDAGARDGAGAITAHAPAERSIRPAPVPSGEAVA